MKKVVIGSRGSPLALQQSKIVLDLIKEKHPQTEFEIKIIKTQGDLLQEKETEPLPLGKGIFTREFEIALLKNEVDLVVHSLKDLPTEMPKELVLAAIPTREDPRDVLISHRSTTMEELPPQALIAASSSRRCAQLLQERADLKLIPIRGNIDTRIKKLKNHPDWDGIILAQAGIKRLNPKMEGLFLSVIPLEIMLPAPGQGALAVQTRREDQKTVALVASIDDRLSEAEVKAERAFLRGLGGGCDWPIAAYAQAKEKELHLKGIAWIKNNAFPYKGTMSGEIEDAEKIGFELAATLLKNEHHTR